MFDGDGGFDGVFGDGCGWDGEVVFVGGDGGVFGCVVCVVGVGCFGVVVDDGVMVCWVVLLFGCCVLDGGVLLLLFLNVV